MEENEREQTNGLNNSRRNVGIVYILVKYCNINQVKENDMDETCSTHEKHKNT
jgi:hypothetical protein